MADHPSSSTLTHTHAQAPISSGDPCGCHGGTLPARPAGWPVEVKIAAATIPLSALSRGQVGTVTGWNLDADDAALLRAMGLGVNARVRLCRAGEPCIVAVGEGCGCSGASTIGGCRIGLARRLAQRITVSIGA